MFLIIAGLFSLLFPSEKGRPDYCKAYDTYVEPKIDKFFKEKRVWVAGAGEASLDCIHNRYYYVQMSKPVSEEEAIAIFVSMYLPVKRIINESKEIRFYLYEYPITTATLTLTISFLESLTLEYTTPYVSNIMNIGDEVLISYRDPNSTFRTLSSKRVRVPELNKL